MTDARLNLRVHALRCEAKEVLWLDLRDPAGLALPPFTAGAHLEVYLANRMVRHYSLCNDPRERHRYCIAVGLAESGRGGSRFIHDTLRPGQLLDTSAPRNHFPLAETTGQQVFIAGGIGITPIMSMIHACIARDQDWRLFYCVWNRARCAFYEELGALASGRVTFHFDDEHEGRRFDVAEALQSVPLEAHLHTCGPAPLMRAVEEATSARPAGHVHFEWFNAVAPEDSTEQAFVVRLAQAGREFEVQPGRSILEVLEENGFGVPYSCREGLCATCRTTVVAGDCDHRDGVLSREERAQNREIMVCVSRALSPLLVLDL